MMQAKCSAVHNVFFQETEEFCCLCRTAYVTHTLRVTRYIHRRRQNVTCTRVNGLSCSICIYVSVKWIEGKRGCARSGKSLSENRTFKSHKQKRSILRHPATCAIPTPPNSYHGIESKKRRHISPTPFLGLSHKNFPQFHHQWYWYRSRW